MRTFALTAAVLTLAAAPIGAGSTGAVTGDYVEARTAEVFTGGCTMNSEAETIGREAVLAWRVTQGRYHGASLEGLAVVLAVSGDRNLGMREMGGLAPSIVRAVAYVDERATAAQREALVALARDSSRHLATEIVAVRPTPVRFDRSGTLIEVEAGDARLQVVTEVKHDPSCGAMQWFMPLSDLERPALGLTRSQVYWGDALGRKWRQVEKRSAFWGRFTLDEAPAPSSSPF
jgi:hypothetical protein